MSTLLLVWHVVLNGVNEWIGVGLVVQRNEGAHTAKKSNQMEEA